MDEIIVEHVTKIYPIYDRNEDRMKEALNPFHKSYHRDFYALRDISFRVEKGETVGIIGTNGSGKSTMLKIITGVPVKYQGTVKVNGTVSSLLELGVGFFEEYTGLENVRMNGHLMGLSKKDMDQKIRDILDFAEIGDFINQPIKTYSSGMLVRLAFSMSVNVDPEILIIDEALAVGDIFFQAKCFHKLEELKKKGTTILFVSHDMNAVKRLCNRVIWIEQSIMKADGPAQEVCDRYMSYQINSQNDANARMVGQYIMDSEKSQEIQKESEEEKGTVLRLPRITHNEDVVSGTGKAEILSVFFRDEKGETIRSIKTGQKCFYCMAVRFLDDIERPLFGFELETNKGVRVIGINNYMLEQEFKKAEKGKLYYLEFGFTMPNFHSGDYLITPAVASGIQDYHVVHQRLHNFDVISIEHLGYENALLDIPAAFSIIQCDEDNVEFASEKAD